MRVLVLALADHASVSQPGSKLNVNGIFDTIGSTAFPTLHPAAVLALRLQLDYEDRMAKHSLEIVIVNQDGKELTKLQNNVEVKEIAPGQRATLNQIVFLQQLQFKAPDRFSVVVKWNGEEKQRIPLDVLAIQAPPSAAG
jgi:hypothetical protein